VASTNRCAATPESVFRVISPQRPVLLIPRQCRTLPLPLNQELHSALAWTQRRHLWITTVAELARAGDCVASEGSTAVVTFLRSVWLPVPDSDDAGSEGDRHSSYACMACAVRGVILTLPLIPGCTTSAQTLKRRRNIAGFAATRTNPNRQQR